MRVQEGRKGAYEMGNKELNFTVFLIHMLAEAWKKSPSHVYHVLKETGILDNYILPCYDTLHTLGSQYLIEDITQFAEERGMVQSMLH